METRCEHAVDIFFILMRPRVEEEVKGRILTRIREVKQARAIDAPAAIPRHSC